MISKQMFHSNEDLADCKEIAQYRDLWPYSHHTQQWMHMLHWGRWCGWDGDAYTSQYQPPSRLSHLQAPSLLQSNKLQYTRINLTTGFEDIGAVPLCASLIDAGPL